MPEAAAGGAPPPPLPPAPASTGTGTGASVLVLGGGPAGATAALQLARLGHRVQLVERGDAPAPAAQAGHLAESLPASLGPLFARLGVLAAVDHAGFLRPARAQVDWPGLPPDSAAPTAMGQDEARGWLVDRRRFAALLRAAAWRAGVHAVAGHAGPPERLGQGWQVTLRPAGGGGTRRLSADLVIDARGRRAWPASGPATVALLALWAPGPAAHDADPRMRIQAGRGAWYWYAPLPGGAVNVGVFVDARRVAGLGQNAQGALYHALLRDAPLLAPLLAGRHATAVRACDATPRGAPDAAPEAGLLRIGDAAVCLDPLSSQGVPAAMRGAVQAACCVHTAWHRPQDAALAWAFHRRQTAAVAARHAQWGAGYHAAAAATWPQPFWTQRADARVQPAGALAGPVALPAAARPPEPQPWPPLDARITLAAHAVPTLAPVLQGDWVVEQPVLTDRTTGQASAYLAGVPIAEWLTPLALPDAPALADVLDAWHRRHGAARTERAFAWLWQQQLLVARPAAVHVSDVSGASDASARAAPPQRLRR